MPKATRMNFNFAGLTLTRTKNIDPKLRFNEFLKKAIRGSELVIDVGANRGQFVDLLFEIGYTQSVIAIEPISEAFNRLEIAYGKKPNIKLLRNAVGSRARTLEINVASNNAESSSFLDFTDWHVKGASGINMKFKEMVKQITLKSVLQELEEKSIFIKIDVQGYELEVLKGIGESNWPQINGLLIEVNLVETYKNAALIEEVTQFLRRKKFRPFRIEPGFGLPEFGQQLQADIIFIRN
jgi:FkbM family methyltransferase